MAVIIDRCADKKMVLTLEKLNIEHYKSVEMDCLPEPVNTHPDMQIHFIDEKTAVSAPSVFEYYKAVLPKNLSIICGAKDPERTYPGDCAYNVARLGKKVIGNLSFLDEKIKNIYSSLGYKFINTKQGYTKCNLCIIDDETVITEDAGLGKTLQKNGINVLFVPQGEVKLKGFDYGFIGGASGFISSGQIAFYGNISKISYFEILKNYANSRGVDIISLSETKLWDFGSILRFGD